MLLIYNPKSGVQKFANQLFMVVDKFTSAGFLVTTYPTQASGDVSKIIAEYGNKYEYLVCSGGDGTIGEAVDTLLSLETRPVFGLIPSGTVNDFATSLNIPKDIPAAADIIINETPKALDIGRFEGKHFSYVAALGAFTDVSYSTPQNSKNMLGKLAYFLEGIKRLGSIESIRCEFVLDDEVIKGDFILGIIGNAYTIAGYKLPDELRVQMDDGLLEVILVKSPNTLKDRQDIISSLLTQDIKTDLLITRKSKEIVFSSTTPAAWTLDGDFGGQYASARIKNLHRAIEIIMPAKT